MSQVDDQKLSSRADDIVGFFTKIDKKVDAMQAKIHADPDSLLDKLFKFAVPSLAGFLAGKIFDNLWHRQSNATRGEVDQAESQQESMTSGIVFAAASAALTAVIGQLSTRGSQALVERRHRRAQ